MIGKILPENCLPKALCVFDTLVCHWQKPKHGKEKFKLQSNLIELESAKYKMSATWRKKETQNTECTCMSEETGVAVIRTTGISGSQLTILATIISNSLIIVPHWECPVQTILEHWCETIASFDQLLTTIKEQQKPSNPMVVWPKNGDGTIWHRRQFDN